MICENEECPLYKTCLTQKKDYLTCADMVNLKNAELSLPPEFVEKSVFS